MKEQEKITIKGAREHNLKNINVKIPINKFSVITGLSGSGKSSLAFDTLYAEGQRRYVESLSAYARQFLGLMNKPDVDSIKGLSPAISIEQKTVSKNPRSTVGTITEIYDYLRLLFARVGKPHCPNCGQPITAQSAESIAKLLLQEKGGTKMQILAPLVRGKKGTYEKLFDQVAKEGFSRVRVDGKMHDIEQRDSIKLNKQIKHTIEIVVDRIVVKKEVESRLTQAIETALAHGESLVTVIIGDKEKLFSAKNACVDCGLSFDDLQPRMFSFNSYFGACPECHGLGFSQELDPELVVPDTSLSIAGGAIKPWRNHLDGWRMQALESVADHYKIDIGTPWNKLSPKAKKIILYGTNEEIRYDWHTKSGSTYSWSNEFEGVIPQLERLYEQTESEYRRQEILKFMRQGDCSACCGRRLKPEVLAVTVDNQNIYDVTEMSIGQATEWFKNLKLNKQEQEIAKLIIKEIINRLQFLVDVGLDYLTMSRSAATLSGGEGQRIRLATQIGSELRGVLYILDEPSIGLHQRDNKRLINTLQKLRDTGNTVVVVEHDEETIRHADYVLDLGPGAGIHGGHVVAAGTPKQIEKVKKSLTGQYLAGQEFIHVPSKRRKAYDHVEVLGAAEHNLKNIDVKIPLKVFSCVTGVSGSGKSTLVNDILYQALYSKFWATNDKPGKHKDLKGYGKIDKVVLVDQSPIGRTPRSNPATYVGVFTYIRELFAQTKEAKVRGYKPGRFSFNVIGGRCEHCEGDGVIKIEMHFLPDVYVECEKCKGTRYNKETLTVKYKDKTIADVLNMTVEEALEFFDKIPRIQNKLQTLYDVGLEYIELGQSATTLSGGEAQRIKLTSELSRRGEGNTLYMLDEPTTGLHFHDVKKLLDVFNRLVDKGNSVLVIEHNLDVIKSADWVIDLGPEGGDKGGRVVAEGTPERIAKSARWSHTGKFLKDVL
ncbi:MAG: excinuclease ABC subunit UvrA [Candidatus Buchananbacteria bacterium CG10_big_fil_rev_8_21_14_0_10_42_9]|uniref:UvrABC system protein A n=1 Tax=Candidatus Buchananbacteria bacterium CG10_big_fil_rev_8_21_14_0_10_42_9 TaxID=1974526 RepID=A0A2H0W1P1_9BACT|nr:MAG: excinuclease ABC subunit UvrA [Candidatus Buchananbacteria bacterium CG10_big_fil_rev_8_21_14_0_10_42_9]